jgi:hypothetical protein
LHTVTLETALIGAIGGLVSGILLSVVRPLLDNWIEDQKERRAARRENLEKIAKLLGSPQDERIGLTICAAATNDPEMIAFIEGYLTGPTHEEGVEAFAAAMHRVGQLMQKG